MYIVMGNGESRQAVSYNSLKNHITYGCNAIHRDFNPTKLIVIDNKMLHEVVTSGYTKNNVCYFRNFVPMDAFHYEPLKMSIEKGEIVENEITGFQFAYYGQELQREYYEETKTMGLVEKPLHYFTWITEEDRIFNLNDMIGTKPQDSGQNATELMCTIEKPDVCYLIGFDLSNNNGLVNNIYKSTSCYAPDYALPVQPDGWIYDLNEIFDKYSETEFIHVQDVKVFDKIETISVNEFISRL